MSKILLILLPIFIALPQMLFAITTIHHDKPEGTRIAHMVNKMKQDDDDDNKQQQQQQQQYLVPFNVTKLNNDRQKRLLEPYVNYYRNNQQNQLHQQVTPFLDSNALPGPFTPMIKNYDYEYDDDHRIIKNHQQIPNYSVIYDKLAQLKLLQQSNRYNRPIQKYQTYIPIHNYGNQRYKIVSSPSPPSPTTTTTQSPLIKTIIHTYTPTQIDLTRSNINNYQHNFNKNYKDNLIYDLYQSNIPIYNYNNNNHQRFVNKIKKPIIFIEDKLKVKPHVIVENSYVAQKYLPLVIPQQQQQQAYEEIYYQTPPTPIYRPKDNTNRNSLSQILKQLQDTNALPHTLTTANIDNSIRTLVKILNNLKKQQTQFSKPIIVAEKNNDDDDDDIYNNSKDEIIPPPPPPGTTIQNFPANTIDGGTPGRPGIDYPALSTIPQTDFNCKIQRYKGFFADINTNCQVWHYCDLNGGQASFLCPNGTIFSQVALTCDWWYNVKCSSTPQLYVLNERLYKYILPLSPKFPEDYSGPLVDKYLALKFQEMEEKMKKERRGKPKKEDGDEQHVEEEKDDSDQLREIQAKKIEQETQIMP